MNLSCMVNEWQKNMWHDPLCFGMYFKYFYFTFHTNATIVHFLSECKNKQTIAMTKYLTDIIMLARILFPIKSASE